MKRVEDGIYAYSSNGIMDRLIFRRAVLNGTLYAVYVKDDEIIALREWEEIEKEMEPDAPCLELKLYGNRIAIAN